MNEPLKITLATGNMHKVEEINLIAKDYNIQFVLPEGEFDPTENGTTFLENALCKAKAAALTGKTEYYLADDSGLCVDALDGGPGIKSARYESTAQKRIDKLLNALKDVSNRNAKFVCAMVVINKKNEILFQTQKECKGQILTERCGENGFGYDPVFFVNSINKGMAELLPSEKAKVSHRALALNTVLEWFKDEIKG